MAKPLDYWNPKTPLNPTRAADDRCQNAIPAEFDTLLSHTGDHAATGAIVAALRRVGIEAFSTDDGKLVNRQTELHVRAVDWQKASVIASRIFVSRKLLKSSPPVEPVKEKTWNDSTWDLGQ